MGEGRREPAAVFLWGTGPKTRGLDLEELRNRWTPEVSLFPWPVLPVPLQGVPAGFGVWNRAMTWRKEV